MRTREKLFRDRMKKRYEKEREMKQKELAIGWKRDRRKREK